MNGHQPLPRIYVDFNKGCPVPLTCRGSVNDISRQRLELDDGMQAHFYQDDEDANDIRGYLYVEGVIRWDAEENRWMAEVDSDAIRFAAGPAMGPA